MINPAYPEGFLINMQAQGTLYDIKKNIRNCAQIVGSVRFFSKKRVIFFKIRFKSP